MGNNMPEEEDAGSGQLKPGCAVAWGEEAGPCSGRGWVVCLP